MCSGRSGTGRMLREDFEVSPPRRKQADETPTQTDDDFEFDEDGEGWGEESGSVIARTISIINIRKTTSKDGALEVNKLMDPLPSADALPALKEEVLSDQFMVGQVVGKAGQHAVLTVYPVDMYDGDVMKVTDNILDIMERFEGPGFKIMVTGTPALGAQINKMATHRRPCAKSPCRPWIDSATKALELA